MVGQDFFLACFGGFAQDVISSLELAGLLEKRSIEAWKLRCQLGALLFRQSVPCCIWCMGASD